MLAMHAKPAKLTKQTMKKVKVESSNNGPPGTSTDIKVDADEATGGMTEPTLLNKNVSPRCPKQRSSHKKTVDNSHCLILLVCHLKTKTSPKRVHLHLD